MNVAYERGVILPFVLVVCLLMTLLLQGMLTLLQREPHLLQTEWLSLYQKARMQQVIDEHWQRLEQSGVPLYRKIEQSRMDTSVPSRFLLHHAVDNQMEEILTSQSLAHSDRKLPADSLLTSSSSMSQAMEELNGFDAATLPDPYIHSDGVFNIPTSKLIYWPSDAWCRMKKMANEKEWHCTRFEISAHIGHKDRLPVSEEPSVWRNQMARLIYSRKLKTGFVSIVQGGVELVRTHANNKVEKILIPLYWRLSTAE